MLHRSGEASQNRIRLRRSVGGGPQLDRHVRAGAGQQLPVRAEGQVVDRCAVRGGKCLLPVDRREPPDAAIETRRIDRSVGVIDRSRHCLRDIAEGRFEPQRVQVNAGVCSGENHFAQCGPVNCRADSLFDRKNLQQPTADRFPHDGTRRVSRHEPRPVRRERQRRHRRGMSGQSSQQGSIGRVVERDGIVRVRDRDACRIPADGQPGHRQRNCDRPRDFAVGRRPDADRLVGRSGDDLSVVRRHCDADDGRRMSLEAFQYLAGEGVPKVDAVVGGTGCRLGTVGIEGDSRDSRRVSAE